MPKLISSNNDILAFEGLNFTLSDLPTLTDYPEMQTGSTAFCYSTCSVFKFDRDAVEGGIWTDITSE